MASAFVAVTGVAAACAACCSMTDVCVPICCLMWPPSLSKTIQLPFNCPVVWKQVSEKNQLCNRASMCSRADAKTNHTSPIIHLIQSSTRLFLVPVLTAVPDTVRPICLLQLYCRCHANAAEVIYFGFLLEISYKKSTSCTLRA